ncbi:MAG: hypothetical protein SNJ74_06150 [Fimbriimonadaceae bacterium]
MNGNRRPVGGQTLVSTLMVILIVGVLAVGLYIGFQSMGGGAEGKSARPDGQGQTIVGQSMLRARDEQCRSQLGQIRSAIQMNATLDEGFPSDLSQLRLGDGFTRCPVGGEPYAYDPQTGQVACTHPGHERY